MNKPIIYIIVALTAFTLLFIVLEIRDINKWDEPSNAGEYVIAVKYSSDDWEMINKISYTIYNELPSTLAGNSESGIYQSWCNRGYKRISIKIDAGISIQEQSKKLKESLGKILNNSDKYSIALVDQFGSRHSVYK